MKATLETIQILLPGGDPRSIRGAEIIFNSLIMAALSLIGRAANGWIEWKNKEEDTE